MKNLIFPILLLVFGLSCERPEEEGPAICFFSLKSAPIFEKSISQKGSPSVVLAVEQTGDDYTLTFSSNRRLVMLTAFSFTENGHEVPFPDLKGQFNEDGKIFLRITAETARYFSEKGISRFSLTIQLFC